MEGRAKVRLPESARKDVRSIKFNLLQIAEEEANNIQPAQRGKIKSLMIEYINLLLTEQRDTSEFYPDAEEDDQRQDQLEKQKEKEELFQQKCELMQKVLHKKVEQCRATTPTPMMIELDTSLPETLCIMKNGVEVPIQKSTNQKIQSLHEKQSHHCNIYREIMDLQKWNANSKI